MKNHPPVKNLFYQSFFFFFLVLTLSACGSFPRAVSLIKDNRIKEAKPLLEKSLKHPVYGKGAEYYLERIKINENPNTPAWLDINERLCELENEINRLPAKHIQKLRKYDASRGDVMKARDNLKERIKDRMCRNGTIPELQQLEGDSACWAYGAVDTIRKLIVNKNINAETLVFDTDTDGKWEGTPVEIPTEEIIRSERGRPCVALGLGDKWGINYEDATTLALEYEDAIVPDNYSSFWTIQKDIWDIFQVHDSFCEMDRFKKDYPDNMIARDCWFDEARDTLCLGLLRPLLTFHRNNPHTALDADICNQILCLSQIAPDAYELSTREQQQVDDVRLMLRLQRQLLHCEDKLVITQLTAQVEYLAKKYPHHQIVFDLARMVTDYFGTSGQLELAREALETLQPLFPDTSVCPTDYYFQVRKQAWFDNFAALLIRAEEKMNMPSPVSAWNTTDKDEYGLVSWGETDEVFFVRRNPETEKAEVMTSRLNKKRWTKPVAVKELSVADDVVPLSMSANGQMMLLRSEGKLLRAYRLKVGRRWFRPQVMSMPENFAGNAWLSPDDSLLLMEYYLIPVNAISSPPKGIGMATLEAGDNYSRMVPLGEKVDRLLASEGRPAMALGGRLLFYISDRLDGLGRQDAYSVSMNKPRGWSTMDEPLNLGLTMSTIFEETGVTYFSEYTGKAFFDRLNKCSGNRDIMEIQLESTIFPENAMRLAGLVLNENHQPIGGGFMEFTPDYQLNVHAQTISPKGTYTYTVPDSTEVVRLFPEIPGYYSERDTTHFLANITRGEIIRDTFILTSFDYIRRNFELVHSTFINGTAYFDNPTKAYPELTRLAKIATRMGAELDLTGHTDGTGAESGNRQLSIDRAQSVKLFLVEKCGFDPHKITVAGYGSTRPVCDEDTEEGRRCNRRVEVVFRMPELPGSE